VTADHRCGKERRSVPDQKEMRKFSRRKVGARLDRECFKSITKLSRWLFPRLSAITPLMDFHTAINRNQTGIGIEAKRKEESNKEERKQFREGSHCNYTTPKNLFSKWPRELANLEYSILVLST
jgi:hypothetical protein